MNFKEKNLIDGMTPKQHRIWEVNQKKRLDLMEIETGTLKEVNGKILIEIWQEMIILIKAELLQVGIFFLIHLFA